MLDAVTHELGEQERFDSAERRHPTTDPITRSASLLPFGGYNHADSHRAASLVLAQPRGSWMPGARESTTTVGGEPWQASTVVRIDRNVAEPRHEPVASGRDAVLGAAMGKV